MLCLDHDAAGIEATGRLTDILREHGHTRVSVLRPEYKDWDEDLKASTAGLPSLRSSILNSRRRSLSAPASR